MEPHFPGSLAKAGRDAAPGGPTLSVVVNTLNAAAHLDACLASVAGIASEIVVVDMHSDDETVAIAAAHGARVFEHPRMGYVEPARNFAIEQAAGDWVLVLDADERLTPALRDALPGILSGTDVDVYLLTFDTFICGRMLQGTGWGRDVERHPRLFRKGSVRWCETIHGVPEILGRQAHLSLGESAAIDHYNYADLTDFVTRLNRYTSVEAGHLEEGGAAWSPAAMLQAARQELIARYQPDVDGAHSLALSVCMAFYRFLSLAKQWEAQGYPNGRLPATAMDLLYWLADPDEPIDWTGAGPSGLAEPAAVSRDAQDEPRLPARAAIRFMRGFYQDEGGWRWMEPEGVLAVTTGGLPATLTFDLSCAPADRYAHFPLQVIIAVNEQPTQQVVFDAGDQTRRVVIGLSGSRRSARIRLAGSEGFVPAELGLNADIRRLCLRFGNGHLEPRRSSRRNAEAGEPLAAGLARADAAFTAGDHAAALDILRQCAGDHPLAPEPRRLTAMVLAGMGDYAAARQALSSALALSPESAILYNELGTLLAIMGQPGAARTAYLQALRLDPDLALARENLALCDDPPLTANALAA